MGLKAVFLPSLYFMFLSCIVIYPYLRCVYSVYKILGNVSSWRMLPSGWGHSLLHFFPSRAPAWITSALRLSLCSILLIGIYSPTFEIELLCILNFHSICSSSNSVFLIPLKFFSLLNMIKYSCVVNSPLSILRGSQVEGYFTNFLLFFSI